MQQHDGRLWLESVLDEGSIFYFILPICQTMFRIDEVPDKETDESSKN